MRRRFRGTVWAAVCLVVVGCSRGGGDAPPTPPASEDAVRDQIREEVVTESAGLVGTLADQPEVLAVAIARRMFAKELGIDEALVAVVSIEEVTWNDGSLGCPRPGESYTQALTGGYRISVTDGTTQAVYHAGVSQAGNAPLVIRCDKPAPAGDVSFGGTAAVKAVADLKERENVTDVSVVDTFVAPVGALVCDAEVSSQQSDGPVRIILEFHLQSGQTTHVYRAWADDILYCGTTSDLTIQ